MQARAAARQLQRDPFRHLQPWADQLMCPWLCPAQYARPAWSRPIATQAWLERRRVEKQTSKEACAPQRRQMATAVAEQPSFYDDHQDSLTGPPTPASFTPGTNSRWPPTQSHEPFRTSSHSPIIINTSPLTAQLKRRAEGREVLAQWADDFVDVSALLDACLRLDRFERAATLVHHLQKILRPESPELLGAHNRYLRGLVGHIVRTRSEVHLQTAQRWLELEIRGLGVAPNATTYALLLKASLHVLQGAKLERTIRRYMNLARDASLDVELLHSPILSELEMFRVTNMCRMDYYPAEVQEMEFNDEEASTKTSSNEPFDAPEEIRPVNQKGGGLQSLRRSISIFSDPSAVPYPDDMPGDKQAKDLEFSRRRQRRIELDSITSAIERWREDTKAQKKMGIYSVVQTQSVSNMLWDWHVALRAHIEEELKLCHDVEDTPVLSEVERNRRAYGPFLRLLSAEKLSAVTILETMSYLGRRDWVMGLPITSIVKAVGRSVHQEYAMEAAHEPRGIDSARPRGKAGRAPRLVRPLTRRRELEALSAAVARSLSHRVEAEGVGVAEWSGKVESQVGAFLISALIQTAKLSVPRTNRDTQEQVTRIVPAFTHSLSLHRGRSQGVLQAHPVLVRRLSKEPLRHCLAKHLPMVSRPREWKGYDDGGYLDYSIDIMRSKGVNTHRHYIDAAARRGDMDRVFKALTVLSHVPWKINRAVFDVAAAAWNSGEALADMPAEDPPVVEPPEPEPDADGPTRRRWMLACRQARNERAGLHSQRCFQNFQLEVARAYLNEEFYFPHNMDFRGRSYPIPPYLNHLAADNCRGLLLFQRGKPLGSRGLYWLKVHLANVFGYDKISFAERESFAMEHLADVYDSATNPLKGRRWWLQAEDPWQCLATCIELKNALDSPDPTSFVSHLPVHQDGTCNGLQHYAALGGDNWGAKHVNLMPGDRPADVYSAVAKLVDEEAAKDAVNGHPVAKFLSGKITRKIVKQTVMTNVYGVTRFGAWQQVSKHLKEAMPVLPPECDLSHRALALYVSERIFGALSSMFTGAHEIQDWFAECVGRICTAVTPDQILELEQGPEQQRTKSVAAVNSKKRSKKQVKREQTRFQTAVVWTTPLGLPVVQPYRMPPLRYAVTSLQRVHLSDQLSTDRVDRRKQMSAFPPNFIHSLDASHMFLSALKCHEAGLTFAAVHDSYWTHAGDVDTMNSFLREAFIDVHQDDVMGRLAEEFRIRYKGCLYLTKVDGVSPAGKRIISMRRSVNSQSRTRTTSGKLTKSALTGLTRYSSKWDELLVESKRQRLLQSDKEEEREEGRQMVTPTSIYEEELARGTQTTLATTADDGMEAVGLQEGEEIATDSAADADDAFDLDAHTDAENEDLDTDSKEGVEAKEDRTGPKKRKPVKHYVNVWLPISFPPIPKKGTFDVNQLRKSPYFFC